jgi:transcription elongation factor Elf1
MEIKPCPFCGGEIDERGGTCNYEKKIMTLDLKCKECGTIFKFKSKWANNPYQEAIEAWGERAENEELRFTRQFIVDHGLQYELLNAWEARADNG